jgi:hypothetical protein
MYISGGRKNGKIKFALDDDIYLIERLTYTDIVGDIRNKDDPNYGEIAQCRTYRLAIFFENFILRKYFLIWCG